MIAALLLLVQPLHAQSLPATQPSTPSQTASEPESGAENGKSQAPPAAEIAPISVPVSDAVREAALLMRPSGATLDQVVAAMVLLNPAEFEHGDLQHVRFSRPLNVPSTQVILREDPDGLALLLLQLDIVAAVFPIAGFNESASSPLAAVMQQEDAPAVDSMSQAVISAPLAPAEDSLIPGNTVWIGASAALMLISLLWLLFRFDGSRGGQPLSTSSNAASLEESSTLQPKQDAAEPGLQLNAATAANDSISSAERMQQLQGRVEKAENATKAAEMRATKAELTLKKMQLQLDFGETKNDE
jgi:hypothetical protein